jgi:hypothetical protein
MVAIKLGPGGGSTEAVVSGMIRTIDRMINCGLLLAKGSSQGGMVKENDILITTP